MFKTRAHQSLNGGFSLLELTMVAAIMGLVGMLAAPAVLRSTQQARRDESLGLISARLSEARQIAMRQRVPVEVEFDPVSLTLRVWADLNRNGIIDTGEQEAYALPGGTAVSWTLPSEPGRFNAKGQFLTTTGYWRVAARPQDGDSIYYYVFPSGQSLTSTAYH